MKNIVEKLIMKNNDGGYNIEQPQNVSLKEFANLSYLKILSGIFSGSYHWMAGVKEHLLSSESKRVADDWIQIKIRGNQIIIDLDENEIEIDRQALIDIVNKFDELRLKSCPRIAFTRYEDGSIDVTDGALPGE